MLGSKKHVIPDVVVFVNGLPLAIIECKGLWLAPKLRRDEAQQQPAVVVHAPAGTRQAAHVRAGLGAWFRRHAAERLPERVEGWRAKAGVAPPASSSPTSGSAGGSCGHRGTIRLNWRIAQAPTRLVDYVVVHELVHLRHRGHGPRLLAGRRPRHARLRAAAGGAAEVRVRAGVVTERVSSPVFFRADPAEALTKPVRFVQIIEGFPGRNRRAASLPWSTERGDAGHSG